jgi:hypothetical protein
VLQRIIKPVSAKILEYEIEALPEAARLLRRGEFDVYIGQGADMPNLLKEIARLREEGVPILIKHYLKLDGKFIAFNVDKHFSNVVDGLVFVDLTTTDTKILKRFMGQKGLEAFLAHHKGTASKAA